jgi:hypothetical protein
MTGSNGFAAKAKEVEALAAATENQLLRMTLRILAQDYRALAEQEDNAPANVGSLSQQAGDTR